VHSRETLNIPANAAHQFHNTASQPSRLLRVCSLSRQWEFFEHTRFGVDTRTRAADVDPRVARGLFEEVVQLAPKYRTELLRNA